MLGFAQGFDLFFHADFFVVAECLLVERKRGLRVAVFQLLACGFEQLGAHSIGDVMRVLVVLFVSRPLH